MTMLGYDKGTRPLHGVSIVLHQARCRMIVPFTICAISFSFATLSPVGVRLRTLATPWDPTAWVELIAQASEWMCHRMIERQMEVLVCTSTTGRVIPLLHRR